MDGLDEAPLRALNLSTETVDKRYDHIELAAGGSIKNSACSTNEHQVLHFAD
jgi:hypothetical protein